MDKTWMPTTAGIITVVLGAITLLAAIIAVIIGIAGSAVMGTFDIKIPAAVFGAVVSGVGVIYLIFGVLAVIGGYYALKRRVWGMALTGSIVTLFLGFAWPLAVASIVFLVLSHKEFS